MPTDFVNKNPTTMHQFVEFLSTCANFFSSQKTAIEGDMNGNNRQAQAQANQNSGEDQNQEGGNSNSSASTDTDTDTKKEDEKVLAFKTEITLKSISLAEGLVYGIVYEPDTVDAQDEYMDAPTIQRAAHNFLPRAAMNIHHAIDCAPSDVEVVESYIAPVTFNLGDNIIKQGSWVLVSRINNLELRKSIIEGELTGYSLEGFARY